MPLGPWTSYALNVGVAGLLTTGIAVAVVQGFKGYELLSAELSQASGAQTGQEPVSIPCAAGVGHANAGRVQVYTPPAPAHREQEGQVAASWDSPVSGSQAYSVPQPGAPVVREIGLQPVPGKLMAPPVVPGYGGMPPWAQTGAPFIPPSPAAFSGEVFPPRHPHMFKFCGMGFG